jgi:hypothetical protein
VTVARLLADQGHVARAREVLGAVLEAAPDDVRARDLIRALSALNARSDAVRPDEPAEQALAPPEAADPASLAAVFRSRLPGPWPARGPRATVLRLRAMLDRVRDQRRESPR